MPVICARSPSSISWGLALLVLDVGVGKCVLSGLPANQDIVLSSPVSSAKKAAYAAFWKAFFEYL
jgi:hypothetical protein